MKSPPFVSWHGAKLAAAAAFLAASPALAHIELTFPTPRYSNSPSEQNKACPCGSGARDQFCANKTSDPARGTNPTTFRTGSTLTVQWIETVGHTGRYRVAFDGDGADLADFNANILGDVADPSDGNGVRSLTVTLPSTPCTNCTLQLIQVMNGNTTDPVADPTGADSYFQCADLVLEADAPDVPTPDAGTPAELGGGGGVGAGAGADGGTATAPAALNCATTGPSATWLAFALLASLAAWRRPQAVRAVARARCASCDGA